MSEKQWVQHISGQGEKWELHHDYTQANSYEKGTVFTVMNKHPFGPELRLPRCEYRLCDPPEVWRDVSEECSVDHADIRHTTECSRNARVSTAQWDGHGIYRLRKVLRDSPQGSTDRWAFIVEKKVS